MLEKHCTGPAPLAAPPQVRIIVSGAGSHRYVDCVSYQAGKEKALQYIRKHFSIPEHLCVAAGDSGNDVLMLEGDHPGACG